MIFKKCIECKKSFPTTIEYFYKDKTHKDYKNYGGHGIKNKFKSTGEFVDYVINELQVDPCGLQIDRINNDGNYERGSIRFVTCSENNRNRRGWAK